MLILLPNMLWLNESKASFLLPTRNSCSLSLWIWIYTIELEMYTHVQLLVQLNNFICRFNFRKDSQKAMRSSDVNFLLYWPGIDPWTISLELLVIVLGRTGTGTENGWKWNRQHRVLLYVGFFCILRWTGGYSAFALRISLFTCLASSTYVWFFFSAFDW